MELLAQRMKDGEFVSYSEVVIKSQAGVKTAGHPVLIGVFVVAGAFLLTKIVSCYVLPECIGLNW